MNSNVSEQKNPLGYEPITKLLLKFALPSVISMLVNSIYNIVDQIFIGRGVGYLGNAATTVSFPIVTIVLAISTLLGAGGSAFSAIKLGEKNEKEAEKTLGNIFSILIILGIIMAVLGLIYLEQILILFGATENIMEYCKQYASIILIGTPFSMLSVGLSNMSRTDGNPKLSMYSMIIGAALNTILDPIYIFIFHWGVTGAAIATITSQAISSVILIHYFVKKGNMRLKKENIFNINPYICSKVLALGVSSCITQIATTILQITLNNSLVYYGNLSSVGGDVALSAMGIVLKVSMIIISICIGIGIGAQPILGFNKGAKQYKRIKSTYIKAVTMATIAAFTGWAMCLFIPDIILSIFGNADEVFTNFGIKCMQIFMSGVFCAGFQIVSTSYFQATGQPLKASILSLLRQILLLIPLIYVLPKYIGLDGILYAGPIADIMAALIVGIFIIFEMRKLSKIIKSEQENKIAA